MNGGYIMIKASDADIYASASRALTIGKPILFYENDTTCYYIDTITLDGTNVVLTKGGKTITIANDNTITSEGDIQILKNHIYALTFNVSDMYYTIFTTKSCGMNNKIINVGVDEGRTTISLTDDEKKSLYDAYKSALKTNNTRLLGSINGDNGYDYANYSSIITLLFKDENNANYTLEMTFNNDNIAITNNSYEDDIVLFEIQLF